MTDEQRDDHWHGMTDMGVNPFNTESMWAARCRCGWFGVTKISKAAAIVAYANHLEDAGWRPEDDES